MALVIGNSNYSHVAKLANPLRDAALIARVLAGAGFKVTTVYDADRLSMRKSIHRFARDVRNTGAVSLLYYAGHGLQIGGINYLIPVNADMVDEEEVKFSAVSLNEALSLLRRDQPSINIVIIDACRNNPYQQKFRSVTRGLARAEAPNGTFLAYSTAPGTVALDGKGKNSPYVEALAKAMMLNGLKIEEVFKVTRGHVLKTTGGNQVPWETSSLVGDFVLRGNGVPAASLPSLDDVELPQSFSPHDGRNGQLGERDAFALAREINTVEAWDAFLAAYPNGKRSRWASVARNKLVNNGSGSKDIGIQSRQRSGVDEKVAYGFAKEIGTVEAWDTFLRQYPSGNLKSFAIAARAKLVAQGQENERRARDAREYIAKLQTQQNTTRHFSPSPSPQPISKQLWEHNGSVMYLETAGDMLKIYYERPRSGMRDEGAGQGSLLFHGRRDGMSISGTAYLFSSSCGKIAYQVSGAITGDGRRIEMDGRAPRRNKNTCNVRSYFNDNLVFTMR